MKSEPRSIARLLRTLARAAAAPLILGLIPLLPPQAAAGPDDFDFGQRLARARYFDLARKVYEQMQADPRSTAQEKEEARYGLALLRKEEAHAAAQRPDTPYEDVRRLYQSAVDDVDEFQKRNPGHKSADSARLEVGVIRLAFVQWARSLLEDEGAREDRKVTTEKVQADAKDMVEKAIAYFEKMRGEKKTPLEQLSDYYYTVCQYYRALVFPPCSTTAIAALEQAAKVLEDYIMDNDGTLLASFVMDHAGLVDVELARCATDPVLRQKHFRTAFTWFEACINWEDQGTHDSLLLILSGYYHMAQAGLEAGRIEKEDFQREALAQLREMLRRHPRAWRTETGLRAMVEWAKLECARGDAARAVAVAKDAAERAKTASIPVVERLANRELNRYVSGGCGGSIGSRDPEVLRRVADDNFANNRMHDAITAYRAVIGAVPPTPEAFMQHGWHAWERIAGAYRALGDRLGEALAYDAVHDAWMGGVIPRRRGQEDDPNLERAARTRRVAQGAWREVADETGSEAFRERYGQIGENFEKEYPGGGGEDIAWRTAREKWDLALAQNRSGDRAWRATLDDARKHFRSVATNPRARQRDAAWVYLVRAEDEAKTGTEDRKAAAEMVKVAEEALAWWDHPERQKEASESAEVRSTRDVARGAVTFWYARGLVVLERYEDALPLLADYDTRFTGENYLPLARGLLVQVLIALGRIDEADRRLQALQRQHPQFFNLPFLVNLLAGHFHAKFKELEVQYKEARATHARLAREERETTRRIASLQISLADSVSAKSKREELLAVYERQKNLPPTERQFGDRDAEEAREDLEKNLLPRIARLEKDIAEAQKALGELEGKVTELEAAVAGLQPQLYEPLVRAAGYYRILFETQPPETIDPSNLASVAQWYWFAGTLRPEERSNWGHAQSLYERYLAHPRVQTMALTHREKGQAVARLGDVYVRLAGLTQDKEESHDLVMKALEHLQASIAQDARNNQLVVDLLANRILVMQWRDPSTRAWHRFPIPMPADLAQLKGSVAKLGEDKGLPAPAYADPVRDHAYKEALKRFKGDVAKGEGLATDGNLRKLLQDVKAGSPFDPILYRDLADASPEFRLTLASAYASSGREEDLPKAVNLAASLVNGPLQAPIETEDWWRGHEMLLVTYLKAAEQALAGGGPAPATAAQNLELAAGHFRNIGANYPDLGEDALPGSRTRWLGHLERLNRMRRGLRPPLPAVPPPAAASPAAGAAGPATPASTGGSEETR